MSVNSKLLTNRNFVAIKIRQVKINHFVSQFELLHVEMNTLFHYIVCTESLKDTLLKNTLKLHILLSR